MTQSYSGDTASEIRVEIGKKKKGARGRDWDLVLPRKESPPSPSSGYLMQSNKREFPITSSRYVY